MAIGATDFPREHRIHALPRKVWGICNAGVAINLVKVALNDDTETLSYHLLIAIDSNSPRFESRQKAGVGGGETGSSSLCALPAFSIVTTPVTSAQHKVRVYLLFSSNYFGKMLASEPPKKRRRVEGSVPEVVESPVPDTSPPGTIDWQPSCTFPLTEDPFLSPAGSSQRDGFSQDPGYLASREELRDIIFSLAHSAAPTRGTSFEADGSEDVDQTSHLRFSESSLQSNRRAQRLQPLIQPCLSDRRRVEYLKNYATQVAPWVRSLECLPFNDDKFLLHGCRELTSKF